MAQNVIAEERLYLSNAYGTDGLNCADVQLYN